MLNCKLTKGHDVIYCQISNTDRVIHNNIMIETVLNDLMWFETDTY